MKQLLYLLVVVILPTAAVSSRAQQPHNQILKIYSGPLLGDMDPATAAYVAEQTALSDAAARLTEEAKRASAKGDFSNAFLLLQQAVSNDPTDEEACILLSYFYIQKGQSASVISTLNPIVNPPANVSISGGKDVTTRMIYVLALLDRNAWRDALACYEKTWRPSFNEVFGFHAPSHTWSLPGGGPSHDWPDPKFSVDVPDYAGLRAQAHLVLGSRRPMYMEEKATSPYMLAHLNQVLSISPDSLDATFLAGWMLSKMDRFDEARIAYASAWKLGSPAIHKEIEEQLKDLNSREQQKKAYDAQQAAKKEKAK